MKKLPADALKLVKILSETVREDGQILFTEIAGRKAKFWKPLPEVGGSWKQKLKQALEKRELKALVEKTKTEVKKSGEDWLVYYKNLPTVADKVEFLAFLMAYGAAFAGGAVTGLQVPGQKITLYPRGADKKNQFTVHSVPQLTLELSVEWCIAVLEKTLSEPLMLDEIERRRLTQIKQILSNFLGGMTQGARVKLLARGRKRGSWNLDWRMAVDAGAFEMVKSFFKPDVE